MSCASRAYHQSWVMEQQMRQNSLKCLCFKQAGITVGLTRRTTDGEGCPKKVSFKSSTQRCFSFMAIARVFTSSQNMTCESSWLLDTRIPSLLTYSNHMGSLTLIYFEVRSHLLEPFRIFFDQINAETTLKLLNRGLLSPSGSRTRTLP